MAPAANLIVASSNAGKLREYRELARCAPANPHLGSLSLDLLPHFAELPQFEESAPTFAENAAGKALHYSRFAEMPVLADDSGLAVDALDGRPGVLSARYAGPNATAAERNAKLLGELAGATARGRRARFICVLALAQRGRAVCVLSDAVEGEIIEAPRGSDGFGYDPVFLYSPLGKTFAEITSDDKNLRSHRGRAFRKLLDFLATSPVLY